MGKRIIDIIGGLIGTGFLIILTPLIGTAIIVESGFPVFVSLERISKGKKVRVLKFRSMVRNAHEMKKELTALNERTDGPLFKIKNDPRLTGTGKMLRKLRIDEFPQFINVLMGDLSLVGPRPHEEKEIEAYPDEYKRISQATAGLTGLSQVNGASSLPFKKELELDLYYIEHASIAMDLLIIGKTIWILFSDPTGV